MGFVNGASRRDELINSFRKNYENTFSSEFHPKRTLVSALRIFRSEEPIIVAQAAVKWAIHSPISKFSINANLTLCVAMRALLKIAEALS